MCGIIGSLGARIPVPTFETALLRLAHRGPNGSGQYIDESKGVYLGHRRLSIIDVSEGGRQPFTDPERRYQLIFNGEIYNYLELREELKNSYTFTTKSDTEVLLASFVRWGIRCVDRLNGMFAFAVYDTHTGELWAARDRLGEKPFFYVHHGEVFQFASEIKALRVFGNFRENESRIREYLYYGFYDHTNETFFEGIESLGAGCYLHRTSDGKVTTTSYWDLKNISAPTIPQTPKEVEERFRELVQDSVKLRMRSDVPVGINLSSGLDSGVLFSYARQISQSPLHAFSMCSEDERYNECAIIAQETLASYDRALWHTSTFQPENFIKSIDRLNTIEDQPYGGIPTIAYEALHAVTAQTDVVVLLEGQGVDEMLAGYKYYRIELLRDLWEQKKLGSLASYITRQKMGTWYDNAHKVLEARELRSHDYSQDTTKLINRSILSPELVRDAEMHPLSFEVPFTSHLLNAQYRDIRFAKLPRVLRFNDHATMAHGRELRLPYLDHRIVEFCFYLPHTYKISYNSQKVLMRKAFRESLTQSHRERQKIAFGAQQTPWLRTYGKDYVYDMINSTSFKNRPYWDQGVLRKEVDDFFSGVGDNSFFLWQCINLHGWLATFIDKS